MSSPISSACSSLSQSSDVERPTKRQRKDRLPAPLLSAATFSSNEIKELQLRIRPIEESGQTVRIANILSISLDQCLSVLLQQVKTCSEKLTESLEHLISMDVYHPISRLPWEELTDAQKNHFFSCLFKLLVPPTDEIIQVILEKNRKCLPCSITPHLYKLFHHYFTRLIEPFCLVISEYLSHGVVCSRSVGQNFKSQDGIWQGPIVTIQIPNHLLLQDAFCNFIQALSNDLPRQTSLYDIYLIYLFARHFEGSSENEISSLKEKCEVRFQQSGLPDEFPQLTATIGYLALQSKSFDSFYKISGPLLYSEKEKVALLKAYPDLLDSYIFISFNNSSFSFLISKAHLNEIPYFKAILGHPNTWKEAQNNPCEFLIDKQENSTDHWSFFSFLFKRETKNLTLLQCLAILRISDYYLCDKKEIEDLIFSLIIKSPGVLHLDDDMIPHVVSHMLYSSRLKDLLERTIWKLLSASNSFDQKLLQLKPFIHFFDSINLYTIDSNQFLKVVQHFSDDLETLNLDAKSMKETAFIKLLTFKKLKKLKLLHFTDFPRSALQVLQGMLSLRALELTDKTEKFATLGFTRALPWESLSIASKKYNTSLMKALPHLDHLTIELSNTQIRAFLDDLKHLQKLVSLHIQSGEELDAGQLFEQACRLPHLQSLTFDKNRVAQSISCRALDLPSSNVSIKELYLCFPLKPEVFAFFPNLKTLHLVISQTQIAALFLVLERLPSLESLSILLTDPPTPTEVSHEEYQQYQLLYDPEEFEPFAYPEFPDFDFSCLKKLRSFKFTSKPAGSQFTESTCKSLAKIASLECVSLPDMSFSKNMMPLMQKDCLKSIELERTDDESVNELLMHAKDRNIKVILV